MIIDEEVYLSDNQINEFFEHHGVKGMHWGIRGTKVQQKRLNRIDRVARGTATKVDRFMVGNQNLIFTAKGAKKVLARGANVQKSINSGHKKTLNMLGIVGGIRIKELNYHQSN